MNYKEQLQNLSKKYTESFSPGGVVGNPVAAQSQSYQQGGQTPSEDWKQKYSTNPYFKDREDWGDKLSYKFPNVKTTVKDSIYTVAKQSGVDPAILYTSAMEEGMKLALNPKDTFERRSGYKEYIKSNPKAAKEYPVDGGYFYGLNTFGDKYGKIIKPSSLPRGFKYAPYQQKDSQGNTLYTSAAFRSHDDAIAAKAAMMKQVEEAMTARLRKNGLNLSPEARKFFDMVGYNMGEDKTIEMIKSYQQKGYLKDDRFLDPNFQPASWKEPYTNVQRRYQNYRILNDQGYFNDYNVPNSEVAIAAVRQQEGGMVYAQKGGEIEKQKAWLKEYVNSPMYKHRLSKEFYGSGVNVDRELQERKNNLDNANYHISNKPLNGRSFGYISGLYGIKNADPREINPETNLPMKKDPKDGIIDGDIYLEPEFSSKKWNPASGYETTPLHEFGHALDDGGSRIPSKTIANIANRVNNVRSSNRSEKSFLESSRYKNVKIGKGNERGDVIFDYFSTPSEFINRIQPIRYLLEKEGIHKAGTQSFTPEMYEKMIQNETLKNNSHYQDVQDSIKGNTPEEKKKNFIWFMNNIAQNSNNDEEISYAQTGGKIEKTQEWWNRYINSAKYLERLRKEFPDYSPEEVQRELEARKLNLSRTYPIVGEGHFKSQGMENVVGYTKSPEYDEKQFAPFIGRIKNFIQDYVAPSSRPVYVKNGEDSNTYNHEVSHSVDEGGRRIPLKTVANLVNKVRGVEPVEVVGQDKYNLYFKPSENENTLEYLKNIDNYYPLDNIDRSNGSVYPDIKWKIGNDPLEYAPQFGYIGSPTEIIARLQPLREELYRKGIHDSATEDISKETLRNYIDQTFQNENEPIPDHLIDLLNEVKGDNEKGVENLQWMLNNIAQRDGKNKKPVVAQKGGNVGNSLKNQLNTLAQKFRK